MTTVRVLVELNPQGLSELFQVLETFRADIGIESYRLKGTSEDVIRAHKTTGGRFTTDDVIEWMREAGYSPNTASPTISKLLEYGEIGRIDSKLFEFPSCSRLFMYRRLRTRNAG